MGFWKERLPGPAVSRGQQSVVSPYLWVCGQFRVSGTGASPTLRGCIQKWGEGGQRDPSFIMLRHHQLLLPKAITRAQSPKALPQPPPGEVGSRSRWCLCPLPRAASLACDALPRHHGNQLLGSVRHEGTCHLGEGVASRLPCPPACLLPSLDSRCFLMPSPCCPVDSSPSSSPVQAAMTNGPPDPAGLALLPPQS